MMKNRPFTFAALLLGAILVLQSNKCKQTNNTAQDASAGMNNALDSMLKADSVHTALAADSIRIVDSVNTASQNRPHPPALPIEPVFKDGRAALETFLATNTKYPEAARKNNITGFVVVGFIVKKDGSLTDFKILKGLGYGCDEEALRVAKSMPPWNPGKKNGQAVDMEYNISVKFGMK